MEIWKNIVGFEGIYEVSNKGNVRRHLQNSEMGARAGYILTSTKLTKKGKRGYLYVRLFVHSKAYYKTIHRMVALAFIPNPRNLPQVNHKNGDKLDNMLINLEWCDQVMNMQHAHKMGLFGVKLNRESTTLSPRRASAGGKYPK